jgi:putative oligomerization/nucleic acid binding protein
VLFLYRPRQTYMPYRVPRNMYQQTAYNREMQERFDATRRVSPASGSGTASVASIAPRDTASQLRDLAELHESGALDDAEFAAAKAKVLGGATGTA